MSNKPGMIKTDNLSMNVGTSRGFMDNKSAGENTYILDRVAGAIQERRFILAYDLTLVPKDAWTFVSLPSNIADQLTLPEFDGVIRFSNVVKLLCCRIRVLCNTPGTNPDGIFMLQLRKGGATALATAEMLINPLPYLDSVATVQNKSGVGKGQPSTPVIGMDQDPMSLWIYVPTTAGGVTETDASIEVIVTAQMLSDAPPVEIIET